MSARAQARLIAQFGVFLLVTLLSVFLPAGRLGWANGWVFVAIISASVASVSFGIFASSPELVRERKTAAKLAKRWDRVLVPLMSGLPLVSVVLAGLDKRFGWSPPFPLVASAVAAVLMTLGSLLTYTALKRNPFFSSHVRIQTDRGHHVIEEGPYAWIRHPGYAGSTLFTLTTPVLLSSIPALGLALVTTALTVLRTHLEDDTLRQELPGYASYAQKVRYRMLPFLW